MGRLISRLALLLLLGLTLPPCWSGEPGSDQQRAQTLSDKGDIVALETILLPLLEQHPGRILEVELEEKDDRLVYEIELLEPDGVVWEYLFNPYSGELLKRYRED